MEEVDGGYELTMTTLTRLCHSTINPDKPLNVYFAPTEADELIFTYKRGKKVKIDIPHLTSIACWFL
jgi:hypothetical protein